MAIERGHIDKVEVKTALYEASVRNGLVEENGKRDVLRNIERGFAYAVAKAREVPCREFPQKNGKDDPTDDKQANDTFSLQWHGEQSSSPARRWLVKNIIPETGVGLISGQWGTYKTFVAIDLAGAVMSGAQFAGRPIKRKGGVLFLAAEGAGEIAIRLCGLTQTKFGAQKGKLPFAWTEGCPTLTDKGAIEKLERIAKKAAGRMKSEFEVDLALIIVDTMSAAAGFTDENKSAEGQLAMNVLNDLSRRTGALVIACDHFGKAVETGTRGTSAKQAAADVIIACLADRTLAGNVANTRIAIRKVRSGAAGAEIAYSRRVIDLGVDEDHEAVTTCVIEWSTVTVAPPSPPDKGRSWPKSATVYRAAMITAIKAYGRELQPDTDHPPVKTVELEKVREEFERRYPLDDGNRSKQLATRRQVFKRSRAEAERRGLIDGREVDGVFVVWFVNPEDQALNGNASQTGRCGVTPA